MKVKIIFLCALLSAIMIVSPSLSGSWTIPDPVEDEYDCSPRWHSLDSWVGRVETQNNTKISVIGGMNTSRVNAYSSALVFLKQTEDKCLWEGYVEGEFWGDLYSLMTASPDNPKDPETFWNEGSCYASDRARGGSASLRVEDSEHKQGYYLVVSGPAVPCYGKETTHLPGQGATTRSTTSELRTGWPQAGRDLQALPDQGFFLRGSVSEDDRPVEGKGSAFSHAQWVLHPDPCPDGPLEASAGDAMAVPRGEPIQLDGSGSTGCIIDYQWTFKPGPGCLKGTSFNTGAIKKGSSPSVVLLCDAQAVLTVSDVLGNIDQDETSITVTQREWETPSGHLDEEGSLTLLMAGTSDNISLFDIFARELSSGWDVRHTGGVNVSAEDQRQEMWLLFDPVRKDDSWYGRGYQITSVDDPEGPFDGFYYVTDYTIRMFRQTMLNPHLPESGVKSSPLHEHNFYEYNVDQGNKANFDAYLDSIRDHEEAHTELMRKAIAGENDPAVGVERIFFQDRDQLKTESDLIIRNAEKRACRMSMSLHADPLPGDLKSYELWFPVSFLWSGGWRKITLEPYSTCPETHSAELESCEK
jgi:hypothetical protein